MSSQDPTGDYFARIDSVTDSLGNCIDSFPPDPMEHGVSLRTGAVLHPGDTITFRCRGTDPQGRDLTWWVLPARDTDNPHYTGRDLDIFWRVSCRFSNPLTDRTSPTCTDQSRLSSGHE
ncbi:hypothetical protein [Streptomyces azureus]|uniref:hypothetical protein n=1 Tax=Streptomyces azureus TaxID=146537 RepID=UPI003C2EA2FA